MQFRNLEDEWNQGFQNQEDEYGRAVYEYAEKWANLMEQKIQEGNFLEDIAKETSHKADEGIGISGFMYGAAVSILSNAWIYGEKLRRWHNLETQIGDEGERANERGTTLNPALLNIQES